MRLLPRLLTSRFTLPALVLALGALPAFAHTPAQEMSDAALNLLATLTPEQKTKGGYTFDHAERVNWHFTPVERKGLPLKDMTTTQRHLAYALLNTAMSQRGFMKAVTIMSLEQTLGELENGRGVAPRDPENYLVTIFGDPASKDAWGWRWEGHHISLNFAIVGGEVVTNAPSFLGTNPAEVKAGPRAALYVLGSEDNLGRKLVTSLSEEQRKTAIFAAQAPTEIISNIDRKIHPLTPEGIALSKLTPAQQAIFWELVKEYTGRFRGELADQDFKKIQQTPPDKLTFAWAGGLEPGQGHYYRIQGPAFLIEFDNTQNNANHIHSVWRDLNNDFGDDPLAAHLAKDHPPATTPAKSP